MKISKLKFTNRGLKGLEVSYAISKNLDGAVFTDEVTQKRKVPLPLSLREEISKLEDHVLSICAFDKKKVQSVTILGISADIPNLQFVITSSVQVMDNVFMTVNTPLVNGSTGYSKHGDAIDIIDAVYGQVKIYLEKKTTIDKTQLLIDYHAEDEDFAKDVKKMSEEEIVAQAREILEKNGAIIIEENDIAPSEEPKGKASTSITVKKGKVAAEVAS